MLATQKQRKCREFTGPTPHSVAIKAKMPSKRPAEHLILERRRQEDLRDEAVAITNYNKMCDLKNDWERITDKRIQKNTVTRRVQGLLQQEKFSLEDRRQKLRNLLEEEEQQYLQQMEAQEETTLERQAKMRERAKFLKEKREMERQRLVEEKLDQQWREQCEELRSNLSRRHLDEVCTERQEQLRVKEHIKQQREEEERMYAELYEKDRLAKSVREEEEAKAQMERNREMLETLNLQKAALEVQKQAAADLKNEEAQLLREEKELRKIEEQRAAEEKVRKQREMRADLDRSIRIKMKKQAKEVQEELALDMKILEQLLQESRNEAMESIQRKRELREEQQRFQEYLAREAEREKERELELEQLIDVEVQKMWAKRQEQWRLEREARHRLMSDVLGTRRKQVEDKLAENLHQQDIIRAEREELAHAIEEHKRLDAEQKQRIKQKNLAYQSDLDAQIDYQYSVRAQQQDEEYREYLHGVQVEEQYQEKLKEVLASPVINKMHPMKRAHSTRKQQQAQQQEEPQFLLTGQKL
ncbi:cilia- and flagella-associated protein 53-like [Branchiostoma lanceolatum]|uniref:cilia- and flagella-associated protein 53-like n=1 Tax=Branchiostoma lanceolatum TaxID=7740 RepID=UPI003451765C